MLAFVQLWKSLAVTILQMPFRRGLASDCRRGRRYVAPFLVNRDFAAWNHVGTEKNFTPYENHATFNNYEGQMVQNRTVSRSRELWQLGSISRRK